MSYVSLVSNIHSRRRFGVADINDLIIFVMSLRTVGHMVTVKRNTKYRPHSCVIVGCSNSTGKPLGVSFHRFPNDTDLHKRWTAAMHCENPLLNYRESTYVCTARFQDSNFERDTLAELMNVQRPRKLKIGAVPTCTVFSHKSGPTKRKRSVYLECKEKEEVS